MPKLKDILTSEEKIQVDQWKLALLKAETRKDINFYRKQIDDLLDKAEERYHSVREVKSAKQEHSATLLANY